jgi:hypothetical protein
VKSAWLECISHDCARCRKPLTQYHHPDQVTTSPQPFIKQFSQLERILLAPGSRWKDDEHTVGTANAARPSSMTSTIGNEDERLAKRVRPSGVGEMKIQFPGLTEARAHAMAAACDASDATTIPSSSPPSGCRNDQV